MGWESESSSTALRTRVMLCATERACSLSPLISSCCPVPPGQSCGPMVLSPRSGKMRSPRCAGETFRCAPNPVTHSRLAREPPPEPPNLLYQGSVRDQRPRGDRGRRQRTHSPERRSRRRRPPSWVLCQERVTHCPTRPSSRYRSSASDYTLSSKVS